MAAHDLQDLLCTAHRSSPSPNQETSRGVSARGNGQVGDEARNPQPPNDVGHALPAHNPGSKRRLTLPSRESIQKLPPRVGT